MPQRGGLVLDVALVTLLSASSGGAQTLAVPPDTFIRLERTACYGECPVYIVTIDARGGVTFEGKKFVRVEGRATDTIPMARVSELVETVRQIGFFKMKDKYTELVTDLPTTFVTVTIGGQTKQILDYVGAPPELKKLEEQIDLAARTVRWIRADAATLEQLARQTPPPTADSWADLVRKALAADDVAAVETALYLGFDPNTLYFGTNTTPLMMARSAAAARALIEKGARVDAQNDQGVTPLWPAACSGNRTLVFLLLDAGANPTLNRDGTSPLQCARRARERQGKYKPPNIGGTLPFVPDYDSVISALEQALAKRPR